MGGKDFTDKRDSREGFNDLIDDTKGEVQKSLNRLGVTVDLRRTRVTVYEEDISLEVEENDEYSDDTVIQGRVYTGYSVDGEDFSTGGFFNPNSGEVAVHLNTEDLEFIAAMNDWGNLDDESLVKSTTYFSVIYHELLHSKQDSRLPLPILEVAVRYYVDQYLEKNSLFTTYYESLPWRPLLNIYGEFVEKYGKDAHALIFGKLSEGSRRDELLGFLKQRMNNDVIDSLRGISFQYKNVR